MQDFTSDKGYQHPGRTSIHERPKEADGMRFSGCKMDTIVDSYQKNNCVTSEMKESIIE